MSQTRQQLLSSGKAIAIELESMADEYHVKSDQHDLLLYEAATIRAMMSQLADGSTIPDHLRESTLLSRWGSSLAWTIPELTERVAGFRHAFQAISEDERP